MVKIKATLSLDHRTWYAFKKYCERKGLVPSHEIEKYLDGEIDGN